MKDSIKKKIIYFIENKCFPMQLLSDRNGSVVYALLTDSPFSPNLWCNEALLPLLVDLFPRLDF